MHSKNIVSINKYVSPHGMKSYAIYLHSRRILETSVGKIITFPAGYLPNTLQISGHLKNLLKLEKVFL